MKDIFGLLQSPLIFSIITIVLFICIAYILHGMQKKPKYITFTEDEITDNMQRQSTYLARKMARMIKLAETDRKTEIKILQKELMHFKETFADVPGVSYEYYDLKRFLDKEKNNLQHKISIIYHGKEQPGYNRQRQRSAP